MDGFIVILKPLLIPVFSRFSDRAFFYSCFYYVLLEASLIYIVTCLQAQWCAGINRTRLVLHVE